MVPTGLAVAALAGATGTGAGAGEPAGRAADPAPIDPPVRCRGCWRPRPSSASWQWQLQGRVKTNVAAPIFDIDGLDQGARVVAALHRRGRKVICYVSVGTWEDFREDAQDFPAETLGRPLGDFPDERWLDIRRIDLLAPILRARLDICRKRGYDAVEPDNLDGFENRTGFPLTSTDQLRFNAWIANAVHRRRMAVALKNDGGQARKLVRYFDLAVVEECFEKRECGRYRPFLRARKAVLAAEYRGRSRSVCRQARRLRIGVIFKRTSLRAHRRTCRR